MYKDNSKYEMIKAKVANDWQVLEHVPAALQTEELCMIALEQSWEALNFVANKTPKLCIAAWDLAYGENEDTTAVFRCVIKELGYEEQESKKPVTTVAEMNNVVKAVKSLTCAATAETITVMEDTIVKTAKTVNVAKSKLSGVLANKGKISSLLKERKKRNGEVE